MASLTIEQIADLQTFLKEWLRHRGRGQTDLRRALRASSIRMPVLLDELHRTHDREGLAGLAERLCDIEALWQEEDTEIAPSHASGVTNPALADSLHQLDLLLQEIREDAQA